MRDKGVYIIAEAGVNHNGSKGMAMELIDVAAEAGANAVKFQTFKTENLVTKHAQLAKYQKNNETEIDTQYEMLKALELSEGDFIDLSNYCARKGIDFMSTAFDSVSLDFLVKQTSVRVLKIPSGEITNGPFILEHVLTGKDLIISTGMSTLEEVRHALSVVCFGLVGPQGENPNSENLLQAFNSSEAQDIMKKRLTLLHCTSEYPAALSSVNLLAMDTLSREFSLAVGYSDHTEGILAAVAAASRGATVIEKHFTLNRSLPGPDHKASLEPKELTEMVQKVRQIEALLGSSEKKPSKNEIENQKVARKSLFALKAIKRGETFCRNNLGIKRPGDGVSPMEYWSYLGLTSDRSYSEGERIDMALEN